MDSDTNNATALANAQKPSAIPTNQELRDSHTEALKTISELFTTALDGNLQLDALHREVELWKSSFMQTERAKAKLEKEVAALKDGAGPAIGPSFTAILIDGDGAIFDESFVSQGAAGGKEAAKLLLSSLPNVIQQTVPHLAKTKGLSALTGNVVINVIVNRYGLAGAMYKGGLVKGANLVNEFLLGLCKAHDSLNVIDAGPGKEAADSKIMAQLRFYGSIAQCGLIVLAGSHDNGYANPIRSLTTEGKDIVLLEGVSVAAELHGLCPVARIPGLLRKEKIAWTDYKPAPYLSSGTMSNSPGYKFVQKHQNTAKISPIAKASLETGDPTDGDASDDDSAWSEEPDEDGIPVFDYDHIEALAKQMIATKLSPPTPAKTAKTRQTVVDSGTDTGTERLNMNIKTSNTKSANPSVPTALDKKELKKEKRKARRAAEAAAAVAAAGGPPVSGSQSGTEQKVIIPADEKALRFLNPRPCHKHYLTQAGCDNKSCSFAHNYKLNSKQLVYLAKLVKDMPCPYAKLGNCSENAQTCIYGHICPHAKDCTWGSACRFNDLPDGGHSTWVLY